MRRLKNRPKGCRIPPMCEIYRQLVASGFSNVRKCIYESQCPFRDIVCVDEINIPTECQAVKDVTENDNIDTPKDIEIENYIKSLVSINRVN